MQFCPQPAGLAESGDIVEGHYFEVTVIGFGAALSMRLERYSKSTVLYLLECLRQCNLVHNQHGFENL